MVFVYVKIIILLFWDVFDRIGFFVMLIGVDFFIMLGFFVGEVFKF